jgi:hypothetical protein
MGMNLSYLHTIGALGTWKQQNHRWVRILQSRWSAIANFAEGPCVTVVTLSRKQLHLTSKQT